MAFALLESNTRVRLEGRSCSLDHVGTISSQEFMSVTPGLEFRP